MESVPPAAARMAAGWACNWGSCATSDAGRPPPPPGKASAPWAANCTVAGQRAVVCPVKRGNGQRVGTVPYGYDLADDGTTLIPNESEQAVIAEIRGWRGVGWTLERIAADLTARRVPTKTGKSVGWTHQAVARIVRR